jgi:hypothetical protein
LLAILVVLSLSFGMTNAFAQDTGGNTTRSASDYAGGTGTTDDTYLISNATQLASMATNVNNGTESDKAFKLTADIDLSSVCSESSGTSWTPIGSSTNAFTGTFDGDGHKITNLYISSSSTYQGLFGYAGNAATDGGATLENFTVEGSVTTSGDYAAGVVARLAGDSTITNVGSSVTVSGGDGTGGIVGMTYGGGYYSSGSYTSTISGCYNKGAVTGSNYVGGIVGELSTYFTITDCYNTGAITASGTGYSAYAGGIAGRYSSSSYSSGNTVTMQRVINVGTVTATTTSSWGSATATPILGSYYDYYSTRAFSDAYYLEGCAANSDPSYVGSTSKTQAELNDATFVSDTLGDAWMVGEEYPALAWETPAGSPTIDSQPLAEQILTVGNTPQALTVTASLPASPATGSDGTLSYQWYTTTTGVPADGDTAVSGATSSSLTPTDATTAGTTYYYYCKVTNTFTADGASTTVSVDSDVAAIHVVSATPAATPTITTQPVDTTVQQGIVKQLTVVASVSGDGAGTLSYQWYKCDDATGTNPVAVDGATEASFTIPTGEVGTFYYMCKVTNTFEQYKTAEVDSNVAATTVEALKISTAAELQAFASAVNGGTTYEGNTVQLTADIDLSTLSGDWTPIGSASEASDSATVVPFKGTFDGQGHKITGLTISSGDGDDALFGCIDDGAVLENFTVSGTVNSSGEMAAGVVAAMFSNGDGCTISNVGSDVAVTSTASNSSYVGGVVGYASRKGTSEYGSSSTGANHSITGCYNKGDITAAGEYVGGIAGKTSYVDVTSCYNTGAVTSNSDSGYIYLGGICGYFTSGSSSYGTPTTLSGCYNSGNVLYPKSTGTFHGAIMGNYGSWEKVYYLEGSDTRAIGARDGVSVPTEETIEVDAATMLSGDFVTTMNGTVDTDPWADGSPVAQNSPALAWEIPEGSPTITTHPANQAVVVNATPEPMTVVAALPTSGTGSDGTLTYQWYKCDDLLRTNATSVDGETSASYTPPSTTVGHYYYYCVVTNTFTSGSDTVTRTATSAVARFTVQDVATAAATVTDPEDITVNQATTGHPIEVTGGPTSGDGAGTLTYQWYKCDDAAGTNPVSIDGATTNSYEPDTQEIGDYYFYCEVVNTYMDVPSTPARSRVVKYTVQQVTIMDAADLVEFRNAVNNGSTYEGMEVLVGADIDMSSVCSSTLGSWTPIGTSTNKFLGTFNGQGHKIYNLYIASEDGYQGLFGYVGPGTSSQPTVIEDFTIDGTVVTGAGNSAGAVSTIYEYTQVNKVINLADVTSQGSSSTGIGGVVGAKEVASNNYSHATITECANKGNITTEGHSAAGIVGEAASYVDITRCYNTGTIVNNQTSNAYAAGIALRTLDSGYASYMTLDNCYNAGTVLSPNDSESTHAASMIYWGSFNNKSWWLDTSAASGVGTSSSTSESNLVKATIDEMSSSDFVTTMNTNNSDSTDGGYFVSGAPIQQQTPAFTWEVPAGMPTITQNPASGWALQNATDVSALTVAATLPASGETGSDGTLSYQWYSNTTDSTYGGTAISGATSASYTPSADTLGVTYYYCVVTNTWTDGSVSATSKTARFTVLETAPVAPTITTNPVDQTVKQADTATALTVAATLSGDGELTYQWYKADSADGEGVAIYGATSASYTPSTAKTGDAWYYCEVKTNVEGAYSDPATSTRAKVTVTPYLEISTAEELQTLATNVNNGTSYAGLDIVLTADIDLSSVCSETLGTDWTPIGQESDYPFAGNFNGQGHRISNIYVNNTATTNDSQDRKVNQGLFGYVQGGATIENFVIDGQITTFTSAGGIAAQAVSNSTGDPVTFRNLGNEVDLSVWYGGEGGIVGSTSTTVYIDSCYNKGDVLTYSNDQAYGQEEGGIVGSLSGKVTITNCYNTGTITGTGRGIGGIVGDCYNTSNQVTVEHCYNIGSVSITHTRTEDLNSHGALFGYWEVGTSGLTRDISTCYYLATSDTQAVGSRTSDTDSLNDGANTWNTVADVDVSALGDAYAATTMDTYNNGYPHLTWEKLPVDKTQLKALIDSATEDKDGATVSTDGSDVLSTDQWVSQADVDTFQAAITAAQAVYDNADATEDEVSEAMTNITNAKNTFDAAKKAGTKVVYDLTGATIEGIEQVYYTELDPVTPVPTKVTLADGTDVPLANLTITYTTAAGDAAPTPTEPGTYRLTITGASDQYTGSAYVEFEITNVYLTVYVQDGTDGTATVAKNYTKSEFEALKMTTSTGTPAYVSGLYGSSTDGWNVATAKDYVTIQKLLGDSGVTFDAADTVTFEGSGTFTTTYEQMSMHNMFYPYTTANATSTDEPVSGLPAVLAISGAKSAITDTGNAADAQTANVAAASSSDEPMLVTGVSEEEYSAGAADGSRIISGVSSITVVNIEAPVNKDDLLSAIDTARNDYDATKVSTDGSDINKTDQWVTSDVQSTFKDAIDAARAVYSNDDATQDEVDAATEAIVKATEDFNAAKKYGTLGVEKDSLKDAIDSATADMNGTKVSTDGTDVPPSDQWVTSDVQKALVDAIAAAQGVYDSTSATQQEVDEATATLNDAVSTFDAAKKPGTEAKPNAFIRLSGKDRYATMKAITGEIWDDHSASTIILASGENFPDAIAASSLAGMENAPLLITNSKSLSPDAKSEIERLSSTSGTKVIIIGGKAAVSEDVATAVDSISGVSVERVSGKTRVETALKIYQYEDSSEWSTTAIVASGDNYPDALSASSYAYVAKAPIFLAKSGKLDSATATAIRDGGFDNVLILGGNGAVNSTSVKSAVNDSSITYSIFAGTSRYETSRIFVSWTTGSTVAGVSATPTVTLSYKNVTLASGANFPDALTSVSITGPNKAPLLLVNDETADDLANNSIKPSASSITQGYVVGGKAAVSENAMDKANAALGL